LQQQFRCPINETGSKGTPMTDFNLTGLSLSELKQLEEFAI